MIDEGEEEEGVKVSHDMSEMGFMREKKKR